MRVAARVALALGPDGAVTIVALAGIAALSFVLGGRLQLVLDGTAPLVVLGGLLALTTLYKLPLLRRDRPRFVAEQLHTIRTWAPFALLYVCYRALRGTTNMIVTHGGVQDRLKAMDEAIFGVSPSWWMERFNAPWLTELMAFGYGLMFVLPLVILILCHMRRRTRDLRELALAILAAFYIGFVIYLLVPAKSPRVVYEYATQLHGYGLYELQARAWDGLQEITFDAFPSLHTGISSIALVYAWRFGDVLSARRPRLLFWIFLPLVILLQLSTLYLRQHYFVDIPAGWLLAAVSVWIAGRLVGAWERLRALVIDARCHIG